MNRLFRERSPYLRHSAYQKIDWYPWSDEPFEKTLESMAKGGFHDQIGGGFHRYSTDKAWIIPHFEKMGDDNAWLLRNYIDGYSFSGNEYFREVAEGILKFLKNVLSHPEGGTSQGADVTPDDEGSYNPFSQIIPYDWKNSIS
ncbi:MAG: DUF255 domain-containing protein [Thermodesulfovibrionales bacterium]